MNIFSDIMVKQDNFLTLKTFFFKYASLGCRSASYKYHFL